MLFSFFCFSLPALEKTGRSQERFLGKRYNSKGWKNSAKASTRFFLSNHTPAAISRNFITELFRFLLLWVVLVDGVFVFVLRQPFG